MPELNPSYPITLSFGEHPITIITDDQGEPWWCADEICAALTISQPHRALSSLEDDEKGRHTVTTLGGPQQKTTINESGLYSLILRSRKPEAKRFKRWVTHEVLPTIRKTGSYGQRQDGTELIPTLQKMATVMESLTATVASLASRMGTMEDRVSMLERVSTSKPAPALPSLPPRLPRGPAPSVSPTGLITLGSERLQLHRVGNGWGCFALELGRLLGYCNNGRKLLSYLAPTGHWNRRFLDGVHVVRDPRVMLTMEGMRLVCGLSRAENAQRLLPALASEPSEPDQEDDRSPAVRIRPAPSLPFMTAVQVGDTLWVCPALIRQSRAGGKSIPLLPH